MCAEVDMFRSDDVVACAAGRAVTRDEKGRSPAGYDTLPMFERAQGTMKRDRPCRCSIMRRRLRELELRWLLAVFSWLTIAADGDRPAAMQVLFLVPQKR